MVGHINQHFLAAGLCSVCGFFYCVLTRAVRKHLAACRGKVAVQPHQRIRAAAVQNDFKVQVRSEHIPGHARIADKFALFDLLTQLNAISAQVRVPGLQGLSLVGRVLESNHVAVALHPGFGMAVPVLHLIHGAVLGSVDRLRAGIADLGAQVDGPVHTAVVVKPSLCDDVLGQRPRQQNLTIRQPHILSPPLPA